MRALTLNVLDGGGDRFDALRALVAAAGPDLVVLQECVGWEDGVRLGALAAAIGVPTDERHAVLGLANLRPSGSRFNIAVLSRAPLLRVAVHTTGFRHCVVEAETASMVVLGAHLVWRDEDARLAEVDHLLRLAPPAALAARAYLLAGDLNALVRHDPYPADLDARLARVQIHKYGRPPRFDVTDRLLGAGWVDALYAAPGERWVTARRQRHGHVVDTRSDYVLLSPSLATRLTAADVVDVGAASDHHAVVADLG